MSPGLLRIAVGTGLASLGLAAGGTGGALLATQLAGTDAVAGLPFAAVVAGSAIGALLIGWQTSRIGRPRALAIAYTISVFGAFIVIAADLAQSLGLLLAGSLLLGPANAAVFMGRYAGADLVGAAQRGRGMGLVLFATAAGAIVAPNLLGPSGALAEAVGLSRFAGLYLVALVAFGAGGLTLAGARRPSSPAPSLESPPPIPLAGLAVLGGANLAMVGITAVAPVHLAAHGHDLVGIGLAISIHVAGMLAPSPATGWAVDRYGAGSVAAAGALLFGLAGAWGALGDAGSAGAAIGFLFLLGLAWNLSVVAGSALITAGIEASARPRVEAAGEVAMGVAAGLGASGAGILAASAGWAPMVAVAGLIGAGGAVAALSASRRAGRRAQVVT